MADKTREKAEWRLLKTSQDANAGESDPSLLLEEEDSSDPYFGVGSTSTLDYTTADDKFSRGRKNGHNNDGKNDGEVNQAYLELDLYNKSVQENDAEGTAVGTARVIDGDARDKYRFELTDDAGGRFAIDRNTGDGTVENSAALDCETRASETIGIRATDRGGLSYEKTFDIQIGDVNEAPTDILFGTEVEENAPNDTPVWVAVAVDPDVGDTFTYELTDDADGRFAIDSVTGEVIVADGSQLNYEDATSHDITIKVIDSGALSYEETFKVDVLDVNEAPSDLTLSNDTVPADALSGSSVGTVSAVDPDEGDSFTYELLDDAEGRFAIDSATGAVTVADAALLEPAPEGGYDITVRVTDSGDLSYDETFTLSLPPAGDGGFGGAGVNGAPTAIALDNQSVQEAAAGAVVGQLTVTDPDAGDTHTFSVDDARFEVVGGQLKLKAGESLDHEAGEQLSLTVTATDQGSLSTSQAFDIAVLDVNEAPTDILFGTDVDENAPNGTLVHVAVAVDPDVGDIHTYALLDDAGGRFAIDSATGAVTVADGSSLDFETATSHEITIQVTDSAGGSYEESFAIHINNINEAPTDLELSGASVAEGSADGSSVGTVTVIDPDAGDSATFELLDDAGGRFAIDRVSGQIRVANGSLLDFESSASHSVIVRATDAGGLFYDENFTITVQDRVEVVNQAPTSIALDNLSLDENVAGAQVGTLAVSDPDVGDTHTFSVDDDRFEVVGDMLKLKDGMILDHETESEVTLNITATDAGGLSHTETFALAVGDINESPSDIFIINSNSIPILSDTGSSNTVIFETSFSDTWPAESDGFIINRTPPPGTYEIVDGALNIRVTEEQSSESRNHTEIIPQVDGWTDGRWAQFGETYLFSFSVLLENWTYDRNWDIIAQWWSKSEEGEGGKNPTMALVIDDGQMYLKVRGDAREITDKNQYGYDRQSVIELGPVESNVWTDWDFKVRFDPFGNGELSIWKNGDLLYEESGTQIGYNDDLGPDFRVGIYKRFYLGSDVDERSAFFDDVQVSKIDQNSDSTVQNSISDYVGSVGTADPDQDDGYTYSLVDNANGRFSIDDTSGDIHVANGTLMDLQTDTLYYVTVRATDSGGLHIDKDFTIALQHLDINGVPTAEVQIWDGNLIPLIGSSASDTLNGGTGEDYVAGGAGDDDLFGNGGNDVLFGGAGNDYLDGGADHNTIIGGIGADTLEVREGTNLIVYETLLDGGDTINGFNAADDVISLDPLLDSLGVATNDRSARINVDDDGSTHTLKLDTTGDGIFDMTVATVNLISGTVLNVNQEDSDVTYGTV